MSLRHQNSKRQNEIMRAFFMHTYLGMELKIDYLGYPGTPLFLGACFREQNKAYIIRLTDYFASVHVLEFFFAETRNFIFSFISENIKL